MSIMIRNNNTGHWKGWCQIIKTFLQQKWQLTNPQKDIIRCRAPAGRTKSSVDVCGPENNFQCTQWAQVHIIIIVISYYPDHKNILFYFIPHQNIMRNDPLCSSSPQKIMSSILNINGNFMDLCPTNCTEQNHAMLRIRDVYPGSDFFPSRIQGKWIQIPDKDPGSA